MTSVGTVEQGRTTALVDEVRGLARTTCDERELSRAVGDSLARALAAGDLLDGVDLTPNADSYRQVVLHAEPDGSFSIVALVWLPGQMTAVHDHLSWCVVGVAKGSETETTFRLEQGSKDVYLVEAGERSNPTGSVEVLLPPGDIHRVANGGDDVAVSIHIYGVDVTRVKSSIRRIYDGLEVRAG